MKLFYSGRICSPPWEGAGAGGGRPGSLTPPWPSPKGREPVSVEIKASIFAGSAPLLGRGRGRSNAPGQVNIFNKNENLSRTRFKFKTSSF